MAGERCCLLVFAGEQVVGDVCPEADGRLEAMDKVDRASRIVRTSGFAEDSSV